MSRAAYHQAYQAARRERLREESPPAPVGRPPTPETVKFYLTQGRLAPRSVRIPRPTYDALMLRGGAPWVRAELERITGQQADCLPQKDLRDLIPKLLT